jgi:hypothetical protein
MWSVYGTDLLHGVVVKKTRILCFTCMINFRTDSCKWYPWESMKWSLFFRNLLYTLPPQNEMNPLLGTLPIFWLVRIHFEKNVGYWCYLLWAPSLAHHVIQQCGLNLVCPVFCLVLCVCNAAVWHMCLFYRTMSNIGIACREVVGRSQPPESTNVQIMVDDLRRRWQVVLAELTTRRDKWVQLLVSVLVCVCVFLIYTFIPVPHKLCLFIHHVLL